MKDRPQRETVASDFPLFFPNDDGDDLDEADEADEYDDDDDDDDVTGRRSLVVGRCAVDWEVPSSRPGRSRTLNCTHWLLRTLPSRRECRGEGGVDKTSS